MSYYVPHITGHVFIVKSGKIPDPHHVAQRVQWAALAKKEDYGFKG
jgi:hypothetical protein